MMCCFFKSSLNNSPQGCTIESIALSWGGHSLIQMGPPRPPRIEVGPSMEGPEGCFSDLREFGFPRASSFFSPPLFPYCFPIMSLLFPNYFPINSLFIPNYFPIFYFEPLLSSRVWFPDPRLNQNGCGNKCGSHAVKLILKQP